MKGKSTKIFSLEGKVTGRVSLSPIFKTPIRPDVIQRGVLALQSRRFQPQGRDKLAGKRTTAESRGVGLGISRVPRIKGGSRAALAPTTVGGRATHPPKVRKKIEKRIPQKEMRLALHSAVAATAHKGTVTSRGHITENIPNFPLVITDEIQSLIKTREVREAFINLGLWPDVDRVKKRRKVRAGKGKGRGRKMKNAVGPLLVIGKDEGLAKAAKNVPGVDVVTVESLNVELLAPGTHPGRLTVWTSSAIEKINEMFLEM